MSRGRLVFAFSLLCMLMIKVRLADGPIFIIIPRLTIQFSGFTEARLASHRWKPSKTVTQTQELPSSGTFQFAT